MSTEEARARLHLARAEVNEALALLRSDRGRRGEQLPGSAFPRSAIMRAAATREGRIALAAVAVAVLVVRPGLIPVIWRVGRVAPVVPLLRGLLNRYLVRRNSRVE